MADAPGSTLYVLAPHGTHSPLGQACVRALTDAVRLRRPDIEFVDAYVNVQSPDPEEVVRGLRTRADVTDVTIVPVLLSTGYHVSVDLKRAADLAVELAGALGRPVSARVTRPLGPDPRLAAVLARRLGEAGLRPGDGRVVTIADAGSRGLAAQRDVTAMSALLARQLGRSVTVSHGSAAEPLTADLVRHHGDLGRRVAVATYLLAPGHFATKLAASGADLVTLPLIPPAAADDPSAVPDELIDLVLDRAGLRGRMPLPCDAETLSA